MKSVVAFLKKVLLVIELTLYVAYVHWEKVLFVGIIALDQYSKMRIVSSMQLGESIPIVPNLLHFTYVLNPGAAFGIFPNQRVFFLIVGLAMLICFAIFYTRVKETDNRLNFGVICMASGSTANLIDRAQTGKVVDFLDVGDWWPIFNFADMAIVFGMIIVVYMIIFKIEPAKEKRK